VLHDTVVDLTVIEPDGSLGVVPGEAGRPSSVS